MPKRMRWENCALCGEYKITTREHVIPRCFYPPSRKNSKHQRIVIPACVACNNGTADDDAHFRNVVTLAGDATEAANEIWRGPIVRSLRQVDGQRRAADLVALMRPAPDVGLNRYRIFPAQDSRILGSVRKVVRGLTFHHGLDRRVTDGRVFADVARFPVPAEIADAMQYSTAEPDVLDYGYLVLTDTPGVTCAWHLRFFSRTHFIAITFDNEAERDRQIGL